MLPGVPPEGTAPPAPPELEPKLEAPPVMGVLSLNRVAPPVDIAPPVALDLGSKPSVPPVLEVLATIEMLPPIEGPPPNESVSRDVSDPHDDTMPH